MGEERRGEGEEEEIEYKMRKVEGESWKSARALWMVEMEGMGF